MSSPAGKSAVHFRKRSGPLKSAGRSADKMGMNNSKQHSPQVDENIYYTGDMANHEGFGVCTAVRSDKWGTHLTITLEANNVLDAEGNVIEEYSVPERSFTVTPASFSPSPGRRFWRLEEYRQDRAEKISAMTGESVELVLEKMCRVREDGGKN